MKAGETLRNLAKPLSSSFNESMPPFSKEFKYEKGSCALEYWEPIKLLKEGSISDIHLVRRRTKRIHVRYKKKREIMKFAKQQQQQQQAAGSSATIVEEGEIEDLYVLKSIMKDHVDSDLVLDEMRSELQTMSKLSHPNIAKLYEAYERRRHIYLIMEYLPGGDLTDRDFTEEEAAVVIRKILSAVAYMHSKGVVHRDLKLENIMMDGEGEVKIIDFGLATKYLSEEHMVMTDRVGTLYAMAPQVLQGNYTNSCDLWSIGVVAYMLLSGINPFWGPPRQMPWSKRRKVMIDRIMRGQYQRMTGPKWEHISPASKEFVTSLLQMDPDDRPTAAEALQSEWILQMGYSNASSDQHEMLEHQKSRRMLSRCKHLAVQALADNISDEEAQLLRNDLEQHDYNGDGKISYASFKQVLGSKTCIPKATMESLFSEAVDTNATIFYNDFIIRVLAVRDRSTVEKSAEALDELDIEGTRMVDKDLMQKALKDILPMGLLSKLCDEVEADDEGKVSTTAVLAILDKKLMKDMRDSLRSIGTSEETGNDDLADATTTSIPGGKPISRPKYVYEEASKSVRKMEYTA